MLLKTAGLLLAGLAVANAGIFQRQCYPETVTVTATTAGGPAPASNTITLAAPQSAVPVTTSDITSFTTSVETVTQTATAFLTITTTSTLTNTLVVHPSTSTATVFVTGLSSVSSNAEVKSLEIETKSVQIPNYFETVTVPATKTVQVVQTMTLVPVVRQSSTYQPSSVTAAPASSGITSGAVTVTVALATPPQGQSSFSSFPTLKPSGSQGISPSGASGPATGASSGFGTGFGTGIGSPRSGTGLPFISAPAPVASASGGPIPGSSVPPFANATAPGLTTSSSPTSVSGTGGLVKRCNLAVKREVENEKRQVGSVITATIDGTIVSWTNSWDGSATATTSAPRTAEVVVTATIGGVIVSWTQALEGTSAPTAANTVPEGPNTVSATPSATAAPAISSSATSTAVPNSATVSVPVSSVYASVYGPPGPPAYSPPAWLTSEFPFPPAASSPSAIEAPSSQASSASATVASSSQASSTLAATSDSTSSALISAPATVTSATSSTHAATSSAPASASCTGRFNGNFTIDFDDLPRNGEPPSSDQYPPFQNPYNNLYWSQGFSYAPPPNDPYQPVSAPQMGVFVVDGNANVHSQNWTGPIPNDTDVNGMFGAGPNVGNAAFYIDAFGASIGCQDAGPNECQIQVNGYALDEPQGTLALQVEQYFYQAPCMTANCTLPYFEFGAAFRNLTALQIQATIQGDKTNTALTWYVDDIKLSWTDNSCDAIQMRSQAAGPGGSGGFVKRQDAEGTDSTIAWQGRVPVVPTNDRGLDHQTTVNQK